MTTSCTIIVSNRGPFSGSSILVLEFPFVINLFYEQPPDTMVWSLCSLYVSDFVTNSYAWWVLGLVLWKNHESKSRAIESQFIKQWFPGSFVTTQLIWRQTPKLRIVWFQNISIPFPGKTLLFAPLTSQDFPFQGVFDDFQNLTFAILPINQNRYSPSSCFLGVFRNCIINKRINVCVWQIVKLWVSQSYCVMTLVCWIYATAITPQ